MKTIIFSLAMVAAPALAVADQWTGQDKPLHLAGASLIAASVAAASGSKATGFWVASGVGLVKEFVDHSRPGNQFSGKDMAFNIAGAVIGSAVASGWVLGYSRGTVYIQKSGSF